MRGLINMTQLPSGSKWFQVLDNLKQEEDEDEKSDVNVLKIPKDREHDLDSSTSVNMTTTFGFRLRWFDDFFSISPTTR